MANGIRRPHEALDWAAIERLFPPPPEYFETAYFEDRETIERKQLSRLIDRAWRAYQIPFHRRRWDAAGFHPSHIKTLDDLWKAPSYTIDDIRKAIDAHPPLGDYQAFGLGDSLREPMRVYMSGGTTGKSRPTLYTAWDRMAGAVFTARALYQLGIRPGDVVLNSWLYGTHNGAWCFDEALYEWLSCVVLTTSTGTVTSTERQVQLAIEYGATAILTTGDYLLRMSELAKDLGYDPKTDLKIRALPNVGDSNALTGEFGVEHYQSYGFHEVQWVSSECPMHDGLHIYEDGFIVQIVDVETGEPLPDGELGSICVTELYKTGTAQFRYNILDLSYLYPKGQCACGSWLRKMGNFAGRGDNMVKLRGVNVWPEGVAAIAQEIDGTTVDYFVTASREGARDSMLIRMVSERPEREWPRIQGEIEALLKARLGVVVNAQVVAPGSIDDLTEIHTSPKPKRFRDDRRR